MTNTDDLTLIELQRAYLDDPENLDLKDAFLQRVARWLRLEDDLMEEMPD